MHWDSGSQAYVSPCSLFLGSTSFILWDFAVFCKLQGGNTRRTATRFYPMVHYDALRQQFSIFLTSRHTDKALRLLRHAIMLYIILYFHAESNEPQWYTFIKYYSQKPVGQVSSASSCPLPGTLPHSLQGKKSIMRVTCWVMNQVMQTLLMPLVCHSWMLNFVTYMPQFKRRNKQQIAVSKQVGFFLCWVTWFG